MAISQSPVLWRAMRFRHLGLCAVLATLPLLAPAAPQSPFVAAGGGVWDHPGNPIIPEVFESSTSGPLVVQTGSLPIAYGRFRAAFGSNGHEIQVAGGQGQSPAGGSIWSDGFVVTGGTGSALVTLSTRIAGAISGKADMGYALFTSAQPFDFQTILDTVDTSSGFWDLQFPNAVRRLFTGIVNGCGVPFPPDDCGHLPYENYQGPFDLTLTASVPITYGQTFYVASLFSGEVDVVGGSETFYNSADFGISAPPGATLASLSGTRYVTAVPEPATWILCFAGVLCLAAMASVRRLR
jgi:hypothetical protein